MNTSQHLFVSRVLLVSVLLVFLISSSPAAAVSPTRRNDSQSGAIREGLQPYSLSGYALHNPHHIWQLPASGTAPVMDGACSIEEYNGESGENGGINMTFEDGPGGTGTGTVYLNHDALFLYVCIKSPQGSDPDRFDSLYLDPIGDGTSYTFAMTDDFALHLNFGSSTRSSYSGNGSAGGWTLDETSTINAMWDGSLSSGSGYDVAEYKLSMDSFGLYNCYRLFGLAAYHHWFAGSGDDYGMPSNHWYDQPGSWETFMLDEPNCGSMGKAAYIYNSDTFSAVHYFNFMGGNGYYLEFLYPNWVTPTNDLSIYDLILIADDTGNLENWGDASAAEEVAGIIRAHKPILGLGEGGYAFFGKLSMFIGYPHGWHGLQSQITRAPGAPPSIFSGVGADPVEYAPGNNGVGIDTGGSYPPNVTLIAMEYPLVEDPPGTPLPHAAIIQQGCKVLWGNSGDPYVLTATGSELFTNTVDYTVGLSCPWEVYLPLAIK